jgi:L-ribulose-5-phosphate 4-epimerase
VGQAIPVYLTAIADEFGCTIPCGGFALIGGEEIGREVVRSIGESPAILLKQHGVFTIGPDATAAVKAAVMVEDVARTVLYARLLGEPEEIPGEAVRRLRRRYAEEYGQ